LESLWRPEEDDGNDDAAAPGGVPGVTGTAIELPDDEPNTRLAAIACRLQSTPPISAVRFFLEGEAASLEEGDGATERPPRIAARVRSLSLLLSPVAAGALFSQTGIGAVAVF
jgi:hypothetical protein